MQLIIILTVLLNSLKGINSFLFFPGGAAGMIFALAIPLELPKFYNVFMSYNFESNYRVPTTASDFTKGPSILYRVKRDGTKCVETINMDDFHENIWTENLDIKNECKSVEAPVFEPMITRRRIYQWIEEKLELNGFYGKACLLRAICEHQIGSFSKYNGVLGDVLHVVLSPHSSRIELGMEAYSKAEEIGRSGDCSIYFTECTTDLFEFITHSE